MASNHSDVLIVGAGIFGTSTAYHLSKQQPPVTVTVIDRTPFPPHHAASTDINKIIRQDYSSPFYMDLATEAMDAWATWPELNGKGLFHRTGWINFGEKGSDSQARIRRNFKDRGADPSQDIALTDIPRMFGGIFSESDFANTDKVYWNPDAGWCDAGTATGELMNVAVTRGVRYVADDVDRLVVGGDGIAAVETTRGERFSGTKVLLATGAWTSSLMTDVEDQLQIRDEDRVEQQVKAACVCVAHYKLSEGEISALKAMPVVIYGDHGDCQPPPACGLLKFTNGHSLVNTVTTKTGHRISVPPDREQHKVGQKLREETGRVITERLMPQFTRNKEVDYWRLCWDAASPTQDHLICQHPDTRLKNLYLAVGGSLHSYKFLPTVGGYVAKVLRGESNGQDKDEHWKWKTETSGVRGAHEKAYPTRELREVEGEVA